MARLKTDSDYESSPCETRRWTLADSQISAKDSNRLGTKAFNLSRMLASGISIPRFFVVPLNTISKKIGAIAGDATGARLDALRNEITSSLENLRGGLFVVRCSMPNEDTASRSHEGTCESQALVERQDVVTRIVRQILTTSGVGEGNFSGALVVQEMVLGDFSGVCFTTHPHASRKLALRPSAGVMLVEVVPGGNYALTRGQVVPVRYSVQRNTHEVKLDPSEMMWGSVVSPDLWEQLIQTFSEVETLFGCPQYIEWSIKGREIWVLQSRPMTSPVDYTGCGEGFEEPSSHQSHLTSNDIAGVYCAYRVSPGLRMHMFRVAAVASFILKHWKGPQLDERAIILTSLLHDIGNIVKIDYDRFPILYPEQLVNLQYWKSVREQIAHRYGHNDQEATLNIAREIGVPARVGDLIERNTFLRNEEILRSQDWELKICAYSDYRVGPRSVMPLAERLSEAKDRYRGVPNSSVNDLRFPRLVECALQIEEQIAAHMTIDPRDLTDSSISPFLGSVRSFKLR
jgi:pyruvate,water dikinase